MTAIKQLKLIRKALSKESSAYAAMVINTIDQVLAEHKERLYANDIPTLDELEELPDVA